VAQRFGHHQEALQKLTLDWILENEPRHVGLVKELLRGYPE
jgi:hypothetical protein